MPTADAGRVVAVVKDLFFMARIRETARLAGVPIEFARTPEELAAAVAAGRPPLVLMDLTTPGWDYGALFGAIDSVTSRPSVLAFTTHALAAQTKPLHARCDRVVTKETLTRELGDILRGVLK
jgi:CheY-like chemotaxis protein